MTQPAALSHHESLGDNVTTQYVYGFKVSASNELEVRVNGIVKTETVEYTVSGVGSESGGLVTFFTPPGYGAVVSRRLVVPVEQLLQLIPNGALPAAALEARLDQVVKMIQYLQEELSRRPAYGVGASGSLRDLVLPPPGNGYLLGYSGGQITLFNPETITTSPDATTGETHGKTSTAFDASAYAGQYVIPVTAAIPANVEVKMVTLHIGTTFGNGNGLTTLKLGGMGIDNGWGDAIPRTSGTNTHVGYRLRGDRPTSTVAEDVTVTANGGAFTNTGAGIVTVHWVTYSPDTA